MVKTANIWGRSPLEVAAHGSALTLLDEVNVPVYSPNDPLKDPETRYKTVPQPPDARNTLKTAFFKYGVPTTSNVDEAVKGRLA